MDLEFAGFGPGFDLLMGLIFFPDLGVDFSGKKFEPFFAVTQPQRKIHTKIHANFENMFPLVFLGARPWFASLQLDARMFHVDEPRLASLTFRARKF